MDITVTPTFAPTSTVASQISLAMARVAPTTYSDITIPSGQSNSNLDLTAAAYPCRVFPTSGQAANWTGATFGTRGVNDRYNITVTITATSIAGIYFLPSGQIYVNGTGVQITGTTPAETTVTHDGIEFAIHGAMKNPTMTVNPFQQTQAFDQRTFQAKEAEKAFYDASVGVSSYPVSMATNDTLTKAHSSTRALRPIDPTNPDRNDGNTRLGLCEGYLDVMIGETALGDTAFGFHPVRGAGVGEAPGLPATPTIYNIDFGASHAALRAAVAAKLTLTDDGFNDVRTTTEILESIPNNLTAKALRSSALWGQYFTQTGWIDGQPKTGYGAVLAGRMIMGMQRIASADTSTHDSLLIYRRMLAMAMVEYEAALWLWNEHERAPTTQTGQRIYPRMTNAGLGAQEGRFINLPPMWLHATNRQAELANIMDVIPLNLDVYKRINQTILDQLTAPHTNVNHIATSRRRAVIAADSATGKVQVAAAKIDGSSGDPGVMKLTDYEIVNFSSGYSAPVLVNGEIDINPDLANGTIVGDERGISMIIDDDDVATNFPVDAEIWFRPVRTPTLNEAEYFAHPDLVQDYFKFSVSRKEIYRELQNWGGHLLYLWAMDLITADAAAYQPSTEYMMATFFPNTPTPEVQYGEILTHEFGTWAKEVYEQHHGVMIGIAEPKAVEKNPANGALNQSTGINPSVRYSEAVLFGTGNIELYNVTDSASVETFDVATEVGTSAGQVNIVDRTLTIYPTSSLTLNKQYEIRIPATCVKDADDNTPAAIATGDWQFTVEESIYAAGIRESNAYDLKDVYPDDLNAFTLVFAYRHVGTDNATLIASNLNSTLLSESGAIRFWNREPGSASQLFISVSGGINDGDVVALMVATTRDAGTGDWTTTVKGHNVTTNAAIDGSSTGNFSAPFAKPAEIGRTNINGTNSVDLVAVSLFDGHLAPATHFASFFDTAASHKPKTALIWGQDVGGLTPVFHRSGSAPTWNGDLNIIGQFTAVTAPAVWT